MPSSPTFPLHDVSLMPADLQAQLPELYAAHGWGSAEGFDLAGLALALQRGLGVYAEADGRLLGLARGYSDGWRTAWLSELIVARDCERQGIGQALARAFIARSGVETIYCEALQGREAFFERQGFKVRPRLTAMAWCAPKGE